MSLLMTFQLDTESVEFNEATQKLSFGLKSQDELVVSLFFNVLCVKNSGTGLVMNFQPAKTNSYEHHFRIPANFNKNPSLKIPLTAAQILGAVPEKPDGCLSEESRHSLVFRISMVNSQARFVIMSFFDAKKKNGKLVFELDHQAFELRTLAFKVMDIFGQDPSKKASLNLEDRACVMCLDAPCSIIIMPCRHLSICSSCVHVFNEPGSTLKKACLICREPIRNFIRIKNFEKIEDQVPDA